MGIIDTTPWLILPFAPDVNYGAGALPWSGTATKVVWAGAPSVGFTPKMPVPAQAVNYLFNQHATALIDTKDRLDQLAALLTRPAVVFDTNPGNDLLWVCPDNVFRVRLQGCGGGGGGGGGAGGGSGTANLSQSGAGGGSAPESVTEVDVVPGQTYAINLGVGGTPGAAGAGAASAGDAGSGGTTVFRIHGGATLATFKGATGGRGGIAAWTTSQKPVSYPGGPVHTYRPGAAETLATDGHATFSFGPGYGGDGVTINSATRKGADSVRYAGGAGGAHGTTSVGNQGGAGGGGGAAGPYGIGGVGGAGGAGNPTGLNGAGSDGAAGGNATGAGGGGGGAGGYSTASKAGGAGGAGGHGRLVLSYVLGHKP